MKKNGNRTLNADPISAGAEVVEVRPMCYVTLTID
jgi:hypothetical protein